MRAIILDTETNTLPHLGGEAFNIAFFEVPDLFFQSEVFKHHTESLKGNIFVERCNTYPQFNEFFLPHKEFSKEATEKNGYIRSMLLDKPCISTFKFPEEVEYMIGHNIVFDHAILKKPVVKLICTLELAKKYLTKANSKGVNTLTGLIERYYPEEAKELITNAHSALQDCKLCYLILLKVLEATPELDSFEKLAMQCKQPSDKRSEAKLPYQLGTNEEGYIFLKFGKYTGFTIMQVLKQDKGYLVWVVEKSTMNQALKDFVKQFMIDNK